jgi:hypothetical protein
MGRPRVFISLKWAFPTTLLSMLYWVHGCGMVEILVGLTCSKILYNKSKKPSLTCLSKDRHPTIFYLLKIAFLVFQENMLFDIEFVKHLQLEH